MSSGIYSHYLVPGRARLAIGYRAPTAESIPCRIATRAQLHPDELVALLALLQGKGCSLRISRTVHPGQQGGAAFLQRRERSMQ